VGDVLCQFVDGIGREFRARVVRVLFEPFDRHHQWFADEQGAGFKQAGLNGGCQVVEAEWDSLGRLAHDRQCCALEAACRATISDQKSSVITARDASKRL
jgi:hypothetical protein